MGEDNLVYRLDPSVIGGFDDLLEKMSQTDFMTSWSNMSVDCACGINNGNVVYKKVPFNLSISPKGDAIYWGAIPGLIFDTHFSITGSGSSAHLEPVFYGAGADAFKDKLFWSIEEVGADNYGANLEIILAFVMSSTKSINGDGEMQYSVAPYLTFRMYNNDPSMGKRNIIGCFLPVIPNIFRDMRICMGSGWAPAPSGYSAEKIINDSVKWFCDSKMNSDLVSDTTDRQQIASNLFRWDLHKKQIASQGDLTNLLTVKCSNYWINGLPPTRLPKNQLW